MKHMVDALKKKMMEYGGKGHDLHGDMEGSPEEEGKESMLEEEHEMNKKGTDLAPNLDHVKHVEKPMSEHGDADHDSMDGASMQGAPHHMAILQGIADSGHMGRGVNMSLHERASDKAKEKMAAIMANKNKKV